MDIPKRLSVRASADAIRRQWLTLLCAVDVLAGAAIIVGPNQSASQQLLRNFLPVPAWGVLVGAAAMLIYLGWYIPGAAGGAFAWGGMAGASLGSILAKTATSWIGLVVFAGIAGFHVLIITNVGSGLDADRERRQRRGGAENDGR